MLYPYRLRSSNPDLMRIVSQMKKKDYAMIENKINARLISRKLKPIREDFTIAYDRRLGRSIIIKKPDVLIEIHKKKKYNDLVFRKKY